MKLKKDEIEDNPYLRIGVYPFINCCGSRTIHSGPPMLPEVKQAMEVASNYSVNIDELMECVGRRLGELTGAEWGIVTSGASAALCHATAACVAGTDPEKMLRLPKTEGLKNRVITLKGGRYTYDHAIRMADVQILELETRDEILKNLDERVVMVALLGNHLARAEGSLGLQDIVELTQPLGVPILIDAAAEFLTLPNAYLNRGATMVAYSGGKYLRGPQPTGLLLGKKEWVQAAWINSAPHHAFGRAMKVGKEEIMGVLAAVEYWVTKRNPDVEYRRWEADLSIIAREATKVPHVVAETRPSETPTAAVPRLEIRWEGDRIGLTGLELRDQLLKGYPRIMLDDRGATDTSVFILPFSLQPGEAEVVGMRIREVLANAPKGRIETPMPPVRVEGSWDLKVQYALGSATHCLLLEQQGHKLAGSHRTLYHENRLSGKIQGTQITFASLHRFEGTNLSYKFIGTVNGDIMEGIVELGSTGQSAPGPLNQKEYGLGQWKAMRKK